MSTNRYVTFASIAIFGCAIDLLTKSWVFAALPPNFESRQVWWVVKDFCGFETTLNHGALFGMGQGWANLFAVLAVVAAIGIVIWLFYFKAAHDWLLTISLGSVTGGIFGNLYDRLGYGFHWPDGRPAYAVRDWILFCYYDKYTWPNFNVADCCLVCGAAMLALHAFLQPNPAESTTVAPAVGSRPSV